MAEETKIGAASLRRVQVRKERKDGFGEAKRQIFLDHLAQCANVKAAAGAAGVGVTTVYDARRREPLFAQQWDEAVEIGYLTIEALLMERAATGGAGAYVPGETEVPGPEALDVPLALDMLRIRRTARPPRRHGGPPLRRASEKETVEAILAQFEVLKKRRRRKK